MVASMENFSDARSYRLSASWRRSAAFCASVVMCALSASTSRGSNSSPVTPFSIRYGTPPTFDAMVAQCIRAPSVSAYGNVSDSDVSVFTSSAL